MATRGFLGCLYVYALGSYHHRIEVSNPSMSRYRGVAFIRVHSHTLGAPSSARRGMRRHPGRRDSSR